MNLPIENDGTWSGIPWIMDWIPGLKRETFYHVNNLIKEWELLLLNKGKYTKEPNKAHKNTLKDKSCK
jgi:hypothetical protein